jgi:tetratricopeptide (TPR) repeat protein
MNKWVAMVVLVLFSVVALAQEDNRPGAKEYKAGEEAVKKGDMDTAITSFEAAVKANPKLFASYYYLGFAYQGKKNFDKTAENFQKFLSNIGDTKEAAEWIANATRQGGLANAKTKQYQKAIPLLKKASSAKPNDAEVIYYLAVSEMLTGDKPAAEGHFAKVNQLQPALDRAWYYGGHIAYSKEDIATAKPRLEKYLELKPDGEFAGDTNYILGLIAMRDGRKSSARTHLRKALQLKPNAEQAPQAHYILGSLAAQAENLETARRHFQKYLQLEPSGTQAEEIRKFLADLK